VGAVHKLRKKAFDEIGIKNMISYLLCIAGKKDFSENINNLVG